MSSILDIIIYLFLVLQRKELESKIQPHFKMIGRPSVKSAELGSRATLHCFVYFRVNTDVWSLLEYGILKTSKTCLSAWLSSSLPLKSLPKPFALTPISVTFY